MSFIWNFFKKIARALFKFFFSYGFVSLLIVVAISAAIWYFGPRISIAGYRPFASQSYRLFAILAVVFVWGFTNLLLQIKRSKPKPESEEPEVIETVDPIAERVKEFEIGFKNAIKAIQRNWQGENGYRGSPSTYSLPWFVVMGFSSAGKSTLIVESDLDFPLAHLFDQEDLKSIEPTEDIDYWVSNEAVFFDIAGKLINAKNSYGLANGKGAIIDENTMIWDAFLTQLEQHRPRRPINGVILCIDCQELVRLDPEQRINRATAMHGRLVEMSERLGTRYTVHVVLTKLDLLEGFHEFFSAMPRSVLTEPFGFTLPVYPETDGNAWFKNFTEAFEVFLDNVNERLVDQLSTMRNTEMRRKVYCFVRQLAGLLEEPMIDFFRHALQKDNFSTAPLVRGVYFTSARQEGVPFNAVVASASREYALPQEIFPAHSSYSKSYFASQILSEIVVKEAGLAGDNIRVERKKGLLLQVNIAAACVVATAVGLFYFLAWETNKAKADHILAKLTAFTTNDQIVIPEQELIGTEYLEHLGSIDEAARTYADYRDRYDSTPYLTLYQGKKIGAVVDQSYISLLKNQFLESIKSRVEEELIALGKVDKLKDSDQRLEALRVYLMLEDKGRREKLEDLDGSNGSIEKWTKERWQRMLEGNSEAQGQLAKHLRYALFTAEIELEIDELLIATTQADLRRQPRDARLYNNIKQLAERQLSRGVNFQNIIGPSFNVVFSPIEQEDNDFLLEKEAKAKGAEISLARQQDTELVAFASDESGTRKSVDLTVKPFFTKDAFHQFFLLQRDNLSVVAVEDAWVAGERETVEYSEADLEAFSKSVTQRYVIDYRNAWVNALNKLKVVNFNNIDHAVAVMEELTGPSAPLERMIAVVRENSQIYEPETIELSKEQAIDADLPFDDDREQGLRISRAFSQLNNVIEAEENEKPYMEDLMVHLNTLYEYLKEIKDAGSRSGEIALMKAAARINLEGNDPIYVIERLGADLPEPLNRIFLRIADQSWKVVLNASRDQLEKYWRDEIYTTFHGEMASRYPFNRNGLEDVPLRTFEEYFGPAGKIETFYKDNLLLFINEADGSAKEISGRKLDVSDQFLSQLQNARDIQRYYFDARGTLALNYTIMPKVISKDLSRAAMNLEGQIVSYSHGPTRATSIQWPNVLSKDSNSQLSIHFRRSFRRVPQTVLHDGPWSGFRLLDSAKLSNVSNDSADLEFEVDNRKLIYTVGIVERENIFVTKPLFNLSLPSGLGRDEKKDDS